MRELYYTEYKKFEDISTIPKHQGNRLQPSVQIEQHYEKYDKQTQSPSNKEVKPKPWNLGPEHETPIISK